MSLCSSQTKQKRSEIVLLFRFSVMFADRKRNKTKVNIPKGVIRIRKLKDRQYNGQKKKDKRTNNDLQNIEKIKQSPLIQI